MAMTIRSVLEPLCAREVLVIFIQIRMGLYATLWNICVFTFQGNYDFTEIPRPTKIIYKHSSKYWNL